ncbi:MAG: hypothetical protein K2J30_05330, partial [Clostridia bacterium]|nr:hypothetical protein [Clostridia bacterium]
NTIPVATNDAGYLGFYFDREGEKTDTKEVTVNKVTVGGVSYQATKYVPFTAAPAKSVKEHADWKVTNGTAAANTLEKLEGADAEGTVDNGSAIVTITDPTKLAMTSDDDHAITTLVEIPLSETLTAWPTDWTNFYIKLKANNVSDVYGYFQEVDNCSECLETAEWKGWHAFSFSLWSTGAPSVSEGYRVANAGVSGYIKSYMATHAAPPTQIVLGFVAKDDATEASVEIGGMTFGKETPTFINDIGEPELAIGEWSVANGGTYTVEQKGEIVVDEKTKYTGVKMSYTAAQASTWSYSTASVSNYDETKAPYLHISFYNDTELKLGIWGADDLTGEGHKVYPAGYHTLEIDLTGKGLADTFSLNFYIDSSAANDFEGTKNIVFDSIAFYTNDLNIALGDATTNGLFKKPTVTDGKLSWSWDAKDAGAFYAVSVPVDNWYPYQRSILHVNVTLSHETALGIWGGANAFTDNVLGNANHPKLAAGTYDLWLDSSSTAFIAGGINSVMFYCDVNNASTGSLLKTVTINSIEFVKAATTTSSPNGNNITVNYAEQKITFAEAYEVATDKDFTAKLESGATVTPGATLYLRAADGTSGTTVVTLPATELTKETAPEATVGSNFIRFGSTVYEYKFGENGEWTTLGSWGNLASDTEFTIYV